MVTFSEGQVSLFSQWQGSCAEDCECNVSLSYARCTDSIVLRRRNAAAIQYGRAIGPDIE